jgi:hypothetical protein
MKIIQHKGRYWRLLGPREKIRAGDALRRIGEKRWSVVIKQYNCSDTPPMQWTHHEFFREIDPLIAAMHRVIDRRKKK